MPGRMYRTRPTRAGPYSMYMDPRMMRGDMQDALMRQRYGFGGISEWFDPFSYSPVRSIGAIPQALRTYYSDWLESRRREKEKHAARESEYLTNRGKLLEDQAFVNARARALYDNYWYGKPLPPGVSPGPPVNSKTSTQGRRNKKKNRRNAKQSSRGRLQTSDPSDVGDYSGTMISPVNDSRYRYLSGLMENPPIVAKKKSAGLYPSPTTDPFLRQMVEKAELMRNRPSLAQLNAMRGAR